MYEYQHFTIKLRVRCFSQFGIFEDSLSAAKKVPFDSVLVEIFEKNPITPRNTYSTIHIVTSCGVDPIQFVGCEDKTSLEDKVVWFLLCQFGYSTFTYVCVFTTCFQKSSAPHLITNTSTNSFTFYLRQMIFCWLGKLHFLKNQYFSAQLQWKIRL